MNIRKEVTEKHDIDEWRKAREVKIGRHVDHTAAKQAATIHGVQIHHRQYRTQVHVYECQVLTFTVLTKYKCKTLKNRHKEYNSTHYCHANQSPSMYTVLRTYIRLKITLCHTA